jgi:hypothetical protein
MTMGVVRWVIAVAVLAGCGRIGFDPLDDRNGDGIADGEDGEDGADGTSGSNDVVVDGGAGADSGGQTTATAHYITGGTSSRVTAVGSISVMTGPLTDTNMVLVVAIHWGNGVSSVQTVQDSFGNGFSQAGSMRRHNSTQSQIIWYKRITAGTTINVLFDQPAPLIDLKWAAYREISQTSPLVTTTGNSGTSATASSMASLPANAVVVASSASNAQNALPGPGYTGRHASGGGVLQDLESSPGMINATTTLSSANDWIMQMVALRPL